MGRTARRVKPKQALSMHGDVLYSTNSAIHLAEGDVDNLNFTIMKLKMNEM